MRYLWFFLSVFCGILGGGVFLHFLYLTVVEKLSLIYRKKRTKREKREYGRKS